MKRFEVDRAEIAEAAVPAVPSAESSSLMSRIALSAFGRGSLQPYCDVAEPTLLSSNITTKRPQEA